MHNGIKNVLIFSAGAALGSVVTWKMLKTTYERIAQEEIDSVKETYSRYIKKYEDEYEYEKEQKDTYQKLTDMYVSDDCEKEQKGGSEKMDKPYVIPPEEFGELDGYETYSLTYYADGVLADDSGDIVDNIEDIVGEDSLTHFGEYEDDSVFVRNDSLKNDYEILKDFDTYYNLDLKVDE